MMRRMRFDFGGGIGWKGKWEWEWEGGCRGLGARLGEDGFVDFMICRRRS